VSEQRFVVCVRNSGYEGALEVRKLYELLPDEESAQLGLACVVDESGEDDSSPPPGS
jgi:hypothetical protein